MNLFNTYRSGTHNNQWILIDPRQVAAGKEIIFFFEEAFSLYSIVDMTPALLANGFVGGYNTPITREIYVKLGYDDTCTFFDIQRSKDTTGSSLEESSSSDTILR